jgi:N-methylhydantoinase B
VSTLDSVTYTILRHRLWAITVEAALALQRVSGSPLATEALDMNCSILSAGGEVAFVGPYLLTGPMSHGMITRYVTERYAQNPGIEPGDMFICNDPYVGAVHQNCVTIIGPVHHEDRIIAWCGATLHVIDVGGATAGQVGIGAQSIFEEAPPIPPLKIVRGGIILGDVEAEYLRRSRTPELNALDLRGKVASIHTIRQRIADVIDRYGVDAVTGTIDRTIEDGTAHLRRRLAELPDTALEHTAWIDINEGDDLKLYAVRVRLEKQGDKLTLDFRGSSPQAGAVINCTRANLLSAVMISVTTYLVFDAPWCPAAVERVVDVLSDQGTVVDAVWPAGVSLATMAAGYASTTATAVVAGELLAGSAERSREAMAAWAGAVGSVDIFGMDQFGFPTGTVLLDTMASGTGARAWTDGIDTGGFIQSMACAIANVEYYEARFPWLYLFRHQEPDTGGPGRQRGGVGVSYAIIPHGVDQLGQVIPHFLGTVAVESVGLAGGSPGATNQPIQMKDSRARELLRGGRIPASIQEIGGEMQPLPGLASLPLPPDDVLVVVTTGGGGWGDPIDRDPMAVARDVTRLLVSSEVARSIYGVMLDGSGAPDVEGTDRRRSEIRVERAASAVLLPVTSSHSLGPLAGGHIHDGLSIEMVEGQRMLRCHRCDWSAPCGPDYRAVLPGRHRSLAAAGPHVAPYADPPRYELVERYCPNCWRLVDLERVALA